MRRSNQRTGDTSDSKEFAGGYLVADGVGNVGKFRQRSMMYGFIDDFEAAPVADTREGSYTKLIEQRFAAYYSKMKIFYISTPAIKQTSNIEPLYEAGDKRRYHVPCPICGEFITFEWNIHSEINEGEKAGIVFDLDDNGQLIDKSVRYRCQKCAGEFPEKHKYDLMNLGKWIPTKVSSEIGFLSYHISALYAPVGMYNWTHYVRNFLDCYPNGLGQKADTAKLKTFVNVVLG
jgi:phage terminase large subunit GpA-like protein